MSVKPSDQISQYIALLRIRRDARQRDARIAGGVFLISILATIALGLLGQLDGRATYLLVGFLTAFGLSYLMVWVRLEILKNTLEFADYVQREAHGSS